MTIIALKFTSSLISIFATISKTYPALSKAVFVTYLRVFEWSLQSSLNIKQLRYILCQPYNSYRKHLEVIQALLDHATYNRDKALIFSERTAELKYGTYLSMQLFSIANDWDDLIIDLHISKEEEISESLTILVDAI